MKKLLTILLLIMLIISFFQITNMYALYKDKIEGEYTNLLGVWSIKVNGIDISSGGENLTFEMTEDNLKYIESSVIKDGKIAPGGQATFEIIVDPTNTDVSILYNISLKFSSIAQAKMNLVKVENYFQKEDDTEQITNDTVVTEGEEHKAVIPIDKINDGYLNHIILYFEWANIEENNESDTILGETENAKISIPIEINLKQYTGEVINNEATS